MRRSMHWSMPWCVLLAAGLAVLGGCRGERSPGPPGSEDKGKGPGVFFHDEGPGGKGGVRLPFETRFTVHNDAAVERTEVVLVSIPFPEGQVTRLDDYSVHERSTAWRVLQRWPDQSVRVAQAQFVDRFAARSSQSYEIVRGTPSFQGSFKSNPWVAALMPGFAFATQVKDVDGVAYHATVGSGVTLAETPLTRTRRHRSHHYAHIKPGPGLGIGRDFLSMTAYITEFRGAPVVQVDLVLGNDYLGADDPKGSTDPNLHVLGDVYIKEFDLAVANNPVAFRFADQNQVGQPYLGFPGVAFYPLLRDTYLADGQVKRWRALVLFNHPLGSCEEQTKAMSTWTAMTHHPLKPVASHGAWRASRAMGLLGGPVDPVPNIQARVEGHYAGWLARNHFGPFGSWGDTKQSGIAGTPRNGPVSPDMARIIQSGYGKLVDMLEGMAWQQGCRPLHMWGLKVRPEDDIYLWTGLPFTIKGGRLLSAENLGRKRLHDNDIYLRWRTGANYGWDGPHDWNAYDNEHWSTDLLFDYWTLTGDLRAQEDLAHMGECLMGMLRGWKYPTQWVQAARCEGWVLASAIQIWLATGDQRLKTHFLDRIQRIVDGNRKKTHPSQALGFQEDYQGTTYPTPHKFYMPWQHGPVLFGYLGAVKFWKDATALRIAEDVVNAVAYAWVKDKQDPSFGLVANGLRYYVPVEYNGNPVGPDHFDSWRDIGVRWGDSPLGGAHSFLIAGLFHLSDLTTDPTISGRAAHYGSLLFQAQTYNQEWRWEKWTAVIPDHRVP